MPGNTTGVRLLKMALVALLALVLGYAAALGIGVVAFDVFAVSQREGANAMALVFVICPFVAVLSALAAAIWYWVWSGRRARAARTGDQSAATAAASTGIGARLLPVVVAAVVGWLAGMLLQWGLAGRSYETFIVALAVSTAPWIGAIGLGGATWWLARARRTPT